MAWFRRKLKGIRTETKEKKDTPEGLWHKTPSGNIVDNDELIKNNFVSPADNFHLRIGSDEYFKIIFDDNASGNEITKHKKVVKTAIFSALNRPCTLSGSCSTPAPSHTLHINLY